MLEHQQINDVMETVALNKLRTANYISLVEKVQGLPPVRLTGAEEDGKTIKRGVGVRNRQRERQGNKMEMNSGETARESEELRL